MKITREERVRTDRLWLDFETEEDALTEGGEGLIDFFEALEEHADGWMPTHIKAARKRKFSRDAFRKAVEEAKLGKRSGLQFGRLSPPDIWFEFLLGRRDREWSVMLTVHPFSFFQEPGRAEERSRALIALVRAWASRYPTLRAEAHSSKDDALASIQDQETNADKEQLNQLYWLNVLGRRKVEELGRERVLSTPAHLVEEMPNGSVLLVTTPTVADCTSEQARQAQARALAHLRPELSFDAVLAKLRERSAWQVPVPHRFHPDVAELLEEAAYTYPAGYQRRVAELNAWQPPEVSEWLPLASAPGSDVPEPARAIRRYKDDSEGIEIMFMKQVPSASKYTLEALIALDIHLWNENFPYYRKREFLDGDFNMWLGAYLGEVMRRHLGGEWVPRKNFLEAQVRVGNRAWLPFLRVRHLLQVKRTFKSHRSQYHANVESLREKQPMVDHSLEQFYRVAERHLREHARS